MATKYVSLDKLSHFLLKLKEQFVIDKDYVHTDSNYTAAEKTKLSGIETGANKTAVDAELSATSTNPVQNKAINTALGNKVDKVSGKGLSTNDYDATAKGKVDNLPDNTTTALEGKVDKVSGKGLSTEDYTSADKAKLANIEENANNYSLPTASGTVLGGVKIGANITVAADGTISVTALEWTNINGRPTKLGDFTNDQGFITKAVSDLTNYYTKTTTYTKAEVNDLIGAIKTIQFQVVDSLPTTGQSNIIYLVANGGTEPSAYDEYAWIASTSKFEKIGSTDIDLSGYWSKTDLVECTNDEIDGLFTA